MLPYYPIEDNGPFIITLVLKAAKQPLTTARSAGEIKA